MLHSQLPLTTIEAFYISQQSVDFTLPKYVDFTLLKDVDAKLLVTDNDGVKYWCKNDKANRFNLVKYWVSKSRAKE
jgi:hypothetical protein